MQAFELNCRRLEWGLGLPEMRHRGSYPCFSEHLYALFFAGPRGRGFVQAGVPSRVYSYTAHLSAGSIEVLLRGQSLIDRSVKRRIKGCRWSHSSGAGWGLIRIPMVAMAVAWRPGRSWAGKMVVTSQLHDNKVNDPVTVVGRGHTRAQGWQGTKEMAVRVEPA